MTTQFNSAAEAFQIRSGFRSPIVANARLLLSAAIASWCPFSMRFLSLIHEEPLHERCPLCQ